MQRFFLALISRSLLIIGAIVLCSCQHPIQFQNTEQQKFPVLITTNSSLHPISVFLLVEGSMNLYYRMISIDEANLYTPFFPDNEPKEVPQFFIGQTELLRIDQWNYEDLLRQIMADRPILIQQLGKQGFRFENLKQMVAYYNKSSGSLEGKKR